MGLANDSAIVDFVGKNRQWKREGESLVTNLEFKDFAESMTFVNQVANKAEQANHHPDIDIRWNKVTLTLSTHSQGGVTAKDLDMADLCESLA